MKNSEKVLGIFAVFGVVAGLAYWTWLQLTDSANAPSASDLLDQGKSYFTRGYLYMRGKFEDVRGGSDAGAIAAALVVSEEGFSAKVYPDPPGQTETYSVGYGHQLTEGDGFTLDTILSESQAYDLLSTDLVRFRNCVDGALTVQLSPQQLAALYDFCYNEGCAAFQKSTLLQDINAGADSGIVASDLAQWTRAGGAPNATLKKRRAKESDLYASGTPATNQGEQYVAQYGPQDAVDTSSTDDGSNS